MKTRKLSKKMTVQFEQHLQLQEKSPATIEKYMRDVNAFISFSGRSVSKKAVISYKEKIVAQYAIRSVNSMLASINAFFSFLGWPEMKVKQLKVQQQIYCPGEKELTREEYKRLCEAARQGGNERLNLILQTICATGIRISELVYITVESARRGEATVECKGKHRTVIIVKKLQKKLLRYARKKNIASGSIFITRSGKAVNRSNVWREMKELCALADVNPQKVHPHNLRHLFARTFYEIEKDIAKLADVLGHSNINTTRIYIISTGKEHRRKMEKMCLLI